MEQTNPILALFSLTTLDGQMIVVGTIFIFALYFALRKAVFLPLMDHLAEREGMTEGALTSASQMRQKAKALRARYDDEMVQVRIVANKERAQLVLNAKQAASNAVGQAEGEAARQLQAGREGIERALKQAHEGAEREAKDLAEALTRKVDAQLTLH